MLSYVFIIPQPILIRLRPSFLKANSDEVIDAHVPNGSLVFECKKTTTNNDTS